MSGDLVTWLSGCLDAIERGLDAPIDATWMARRHSDQARVEAERRLMVGHRPVERGEAGVDVCSCCADFGTNGEGEFVAGDEPWPCPTLKALAYGHRYDHPGYRDKWAPDV